MKNEVLVTGATGFIGRHLVRRLASTNWRVIALARNATAHEWPSGARARDLPDLERAVDWAPLLEGATHFVHLAGLAHASSACPNSQYQIVNAEAPAALARAARDAAVRRLVLLSSVRAQSGPCAERTLREHDSPHPTDAYGCSKLAAERRVAATLDGSTTEWVTLRPVLVYGPGVKGNMRTLIKLARLPLPLPFAALSGRRSLLGIDNLTSAIAHALTEPRCAGRIFLVADARPVTIPEIVTALRAGLGRNPGLFSVSPRWLALFAQIAGLTEAWERLAGNLVADASALYDTGWRPSLPTWEALAATARADA